VTFLSDGIYIKINNIIIIIKVQAIRSSHTEYNVNMFIKNKQHAWCAQRLYTYWTYRPL
jgi:hypothetical protein